MTSEEVRELVEIYSGTKKLFSVYASVGEPDSSILKTCKIHQKSYGQTLPKNARVVRPKKK